VTKPQAGLPPTPAQPVVEVIALRIARQVSGETND